MATIGTAAGTQTPSTTQYAWKDRFETPTPDTLMDQLAGVHTDILALLRTGLLASNAPREKIKWHGVPWCWTLEYRQRKAAHAIAFLIPEPGRPRLCLPLTAEFVCSLELSAIAKTLRDGILSGTQVNDLLWVEWEPAAKSHVAELLWLIDQLTAADDQPAR